MKKREEAFAFSNQPSCPSSATLLNLINDSLPALALQGTELHLAGCDFCAAELQLLSRHPPRSDESQVRANVPLWVWSFAGLHLLKNARTNRPQRRHEA